MAAPFTLRKIGVPPNSANLTEARRRVFDFFRAACRSIPTIMDIYNLQDVVARSQLRFAISAQIRNNAHVTDPKVLSPNLTLINPIPFFFLKLESFLVNLIIYLMFRRLTLRSIALLTLFNCHLCLKVESFSL